MVIVCLKGIQEHVMDRSRVVVAVTFRWVIYAPPPRSDQLRIIIMGHMDTAGSNGCCIPFQRGLVIVLQGEPLSLIKLHGSSGCCGFGLGHMLWPTVRCHIPCPAMLHYMLYLFRACGLSSNRGDIVVLF